MFFINFSFFSVQLGNRKKICLRVRLEILVAVVRNQGRHLDLILKFLERLIEIPVVVPLCLYKVGAIENIRIVEEPDLLSRMENVWEGKNEIQKTSDEIGVHVGVQRILACVTCYKIEEGHDHTACKLREETRIINACKEIDEMIERNKEHVERLERVENDLLRMLCELEIKPRV